MSRRVASIASIAALLVVFLSAASAGRLVSDEINDDEPWQPPSWYRGKDGPIFNVLSSEGDVEQRAYQSNKWVSATIINATYDDAYKQGTKLLDDYWKGNNQAEVKVDATVPTFTLLHPTGQGQAIATEFTIEYFLPHELFDAPPTPATSELTVIDTPAYNVWVKTFGGFVQEKDLIQQVFSFIEDLKARQVNIDTTKVGLAIYDEPLRLISRHNEIWIWETPSPSIKRNSKTTTRGYDMRAPLSLKRWIAGVWRP